LPREALRSEDNAHHAAEQQRDHVRRAFAARLNDLPTGGFAELIATWLNAEGVTALRAVRRPSSSERELHFAGTLRRGAEELRLAIVVLRSGHDIDAPHLTEVRGSLHHYGNASQAWIVTTGRVSQRARDEAAAEHAAPCALLSGADLARTMEALGIGLKVHTVALCDIDFDLLEALGDGGLLRERERERQRERDERARREQPQPRASADSEGDGEPTGERDVRAPEIDLLDAEAAEASRLVGERSWNDEGGATEDRGTETVAPDVDDEAGEIDFSRDEPSDEIDDGSDDESDDDDGEGEDVEIDEDAAEAGGDDEREG
jgi:hypothetical protein